MRLSHPHFATLTHTAFEPEDVVNPPEASQDNVSS